MVVAFDRPEPTFRHEAVPTYKAGRAETPDILRQQMGLVREVIDSLAIPTLEQVGVEADDIIATLATRARDEGRDVLVVTGDRDCYQLVEDPHVKVLYNKRGVSDYALYDEAGIEERTGVRPELYVLYAALRGDPSDNLPGVPGVGEKTAAKLINGYGSLDELFAHLDDQTPKLRQNLTEHEAQARSNAEMMVLRRDVDLGVELDELKVGEPDVDEVKRLFEFLEFRSLWDRLTEALGSDLGALGRRVHGPGGRGGRPRPTRPTRWPGSRPSPPATGTSRWRWRPAWSGTPRWDADPLGLALVARRRVRRRALARPRPPGRAARAGRGGGAARRTRRPGRRRPRRQAAPALAGPHRPGRAAPCRRSPGSGSTPPWPPTSSTRPRAATTWRRCWPAWPTPSWPPTTTPPPRASST